MTSPSVHWKEIPMKPSDASSAFQRLSEKTVSCQKLGSSQLLKICQGGGEEIVLTGSLLGFGGVGWWSYRRRSPQECFSNDEIISFASVFCNNPRNIGIWSRKSISRFRTARVPPTIIAVMSSHAVMTKIVDITSSPGAHPSAMFITISHALSGDVLMLNQIMSIRSHGMTLARKVYLLVARAASTLQCTVIVKLLWDGRAISDDEVGKMRLMDLLTHWRIYDRSLAIQSGVKRRRITGKSSCNERSPGIQNKQT